MTFGNHQQWISVEAPKGRRMRSVHKFPLWVSFAAGTFALISGWPGFLSPDSAKMLSEANSALFSDWHSPMLSWLWKTAGASTSLGPIIPYAVQTVGLWIGLYLCFRVMLGRGEKYRQLVVVTALLVLLMPASWTAAWIWQDAFLLIIFILMLGIGLYSSTIPGVAGWTCLSILAALAVGVRWYLFPSVLFALFALGHLSEPHIRKKVYLVTLGGFLCSATLVLFGLSKIAPEKSYVAASTLTLDLARLECTSPSGRAVVPELFLVRNGEANASICNRFSLFSHDPIFAGFNAGADGTFYRFPVDDREFLLLRDTWIAALRQSPLPLIEARVRLSAAYLVSPSGIWWSPSVFVTGVSESIASRIGLGSEFGFRPRGSLLLVVRSAAGFLIDSATFGLFGRLFGLTGCLLAPVAALVFLREKTQLRRFAPLVSLPLIYVFNFAIFAPHFDTRYIMPGAVWGLVASLVAFSMRDAPSDAN